MTRLCCALLLTASVWGAALECPLDQELSEGMSWVYQAEVTTFSSPGLVFTYELTLTMRTGERVESSSLPAGFEWLLIHFQGWSLEVTVDLPWERRKETVVVWHVSPLIPILRWPLPVLFVVDQDILYPFLWVSATVGIPQKPEGSAVMLRELQGPTGEAIPVRIELIVNQAHDLPLTVEARGEVCRMDYKAQAGSRVHRGTAWWSNSMQGWVYTEGEVAELGAPVLRYRLVLKDRWPAAPQT